MDRTVAEIIFRVDAKTRKAEADLNSVATKLRSLRTVGITALIGIAASSGLATAAIGAVGLAAAATAAIMPVLAGAGLAALAALVIANISEAEQIVNTWESTKERIGSVWDEITELWIGSVTRGMDVLAEQFEAAGPALMEGFETFREMFDGFVEGIANSNIGERLAQTFADGMANIQPMIDGLIEIIPEMITGWEKFSESVTGAMGDSADGISDLWANITGELLPALGDMIGALIRLGGDEGVSAFNVITMLADGFTDLADSINESDFFKGLMDGLSDFGESLFSVIDDMVQGLGPGLGDVLTNLGGVLEGLSPVLETFGAFFEVIAQFLADALVAVQPFIEALGTMLQPIMEVLQEIFLKVASDALPRLVDAVLNLFDALDPLIEPLADLVVVLLELGAEVLIQVVEGFAALVDLLVSSGLMDVLVGIIEWVTDFISKNSSLIGMLLSFVVGFASFGKGAGLVGRAVGKMGKWFEWLGPVMRTLRRIFGVVIDVIQFFARVVGAYFRFIWEVVEAFFPIWRTLGRVIMRVMRGAGRVVSRVVKWIGERFTAWVDALMHARNFIARVISAIIVRFYRMWSSIRRTMNRVVRFIRRAWNWVKDLFNSARNAIRGAMASIRNVISSAWNRITSRFSSARNRIRGIINALKQVFRGLVTAGRNLRDRLVSAVKKLYNSIRSKFADAERRARAFQDAVAAVWTGIKAAFAGALTAMTQFGRDIIQGLINGFNDMLGSLKSTWNSIIDSIPGGFADGLKIGSPSRVMEEMGMDTVRGIHEGIKKAANLPIRAIHEVSAGIAQAPAPVSPAGFNAMGSQTIIVELDGRTIGEAAGHYMAGKIRVRTGVRNI